MPTVHADLLLEPLSLTITPALTASLHAMSPAFATLATAVQSQQEPLPHVLARAPRQQLLLDVGVHRVHVVCNTGSLPGSLHWDACVTDVRLEVGVSDRDARVLVRGAMRCSMRGGLFDR